MERTKKELESMIWDNKETETLLRKWKRRLLVAILPGEVEKCKFKIKEYSTPTKSN